MAEWRFLFLSVLGVLKVVIFFSPFFPIRCIYFKRGHTTMSCFFSSVSFVFFFFTLNYGDSDWSGGREKGAECHTYLQGNGREGFRVTLTGRFFLFCLCYLVFGIGDWGLGILMMFLILMIVIAIMGPICGICGAGLMGVYVCSYCSYLSSLLRLSIEFSYTHYGAQRRVRG